MCLGELEDSSPYIGPCTNTACTPDEAVAPRRHPCKLSSVGCLDMPPWLALILFRTADTHSSVHMSMLRLETFGVSSTCGLLSADSAPKHSSLAIEMAATLI